MRALEDSQRRKRAEAVRPVAAKAEVVPPAVVARAEELPEVAEDEDALTHCL